MRVFEGIDEFVAAEGSELGSSDWIEVDQRRIDLFADATGDHQWIHVDPERAAGGPFGGTIAHGFLTLSMLPVIWHQLYEVEGVRLAVNYGLGKVRFIAPVPAGAKIRGTAAIKDVTALDGAVQATVTTTIEIQGAEKPAAVVESIVRYIA
ncbi:MAG: MaoC family dehydratase [Nocardioides sp.]|uniref:MaoC family dehydratase n=1 Tax=Nocardioides sp. TaxID=35761 RepID=UPI0039E3F6AD